MVDLGECPRCGNDDVVHVVYGLLGPGAFENPPPWVRFAGCVVRPENRVCRACGHEWYDERPTPSWESSAPES